MVSPMKAFLRTLVAGLLAAAVLAPAAFAGPQSVQLTDKSGQNTAPVDPTNGLTVNCVHGCSIPSSTPTAGTSSTVVTGGTQVTAVTGPVNGCYVQNPLSSTNQGIATAEDLFLNPVTVATTTGNGTTADIAPGQSFNCPPGMTTNLSAVAVTSGHKFTLVIW